MVRHCLNIAIFMISVSAGSVAIAQTAEENCDQKARKESGLRGRAPSLHERTGRTTLSIGGSAAFGISGGSSYAAAPPFAGQAALERRQKKAEEKYLRVYRDCIGSQ